MDELDSGFLTALQKGRIEALKASREVLAERSGGPFTSTVKSVDTIDLVNVASWIIDGKDPWRSKNEDTTE